jgi:hypothetical protein
MWTRVTERLHANASLPDSFRNLTPADLLGQENSNYIGWLDDEYAHRFMQALSELMPHLPPEICGNILSTSNGETVDLETMLSYADSTALESWGMVLEQVVLARAASVRRPLATDEDVHATMRALIGQMTEENRARLLTIASNPPPTPVDGCWSVEQVLNGLAELRPAELGPVVRKLFGTAPAE